jgi:hypothetical protein
LVGLTEDQVKEQLDNNELTEDTIKATIAINDYQTKYADQVRQLSNIANSLTTTQKHSLEGTGSLTETEARKINITSFKQFQNELGQIDLSNHYDYEEAKNLLSQELELTEAQIAALRAEIDKYEVEGDLRRDVQLSIKNKMEINSYQGIRHKKGLPVRGQRTSRNAKTRKGKGKVVANKKKAGK